MKNKHVIIVAGPTAVGKTAVAIQLALHLGTEIISADSRQCYRELRIGVARPSDEELARVPHHFIATHSIHATVTAADFEAFALQKASELFQHHDSIVLVGGTGLYIRAFCEGLHAIPPVPETIRNQVMEGYRKHGLEWLQQQVREKDPVFHAEGETQNPRRMMRALEVVEATGHSILSYREAAKKPRDFSVTRIGLDLPREQLIRNINIRVDQMMEDGLLEEVRSLYPYRHLNALQTVGYAELFEYLEGKCSLPDAVERIRVNTRQYAKRQLTWFRKEPGMNWFSPLDQAEIIKSVDAAVKG